MNTLLSVIVPVYNQEKDIEAVINKANTIPVEKEIIVVNDCSKDNTESILRGLSLNSLKIVHHISSRGKAAAVRTGLENAAGEFVLVLDGDLGYAPSDYLKLLEAAKDPAVDIVLGARFSRMQQGVRVLKAKNYFLTAVLNIFFGVKLHDWFSRYQLIRRQNLLELVLKSRSAEISFEILTKALRKKMRVIEVPVCDGQ